jgi:hypothetical protein
MKITKRTLLLSIALMTALACATSARATTFNYDFTLTDGTHTFNVAQTITATPLSGGYYGITNVNGSITYGPTTIPLNGSAELYDWAGLGNYNILTIPNTSFYPITTYAINPQNEKTFMAYDNILNLSGAGPIFGDYGEYFVFEAGGNTYYTNLFFNSVVSNLNPYPNYSYYIVQQSETSANPLTYSYTNFDFGTFDIDSGPVNPPTPEPSTWMLLGSGLLMLAGLALKSRREGLTQHA